MADRKTFTSRQPGDAPRVNPLEGVYFVLDGERFDCRGTVRLLDQSDLALLAAQGMGDMSRPEAIGAAAAFLRIALGTDEYLRLKAHIAAHDTADDVVLAIMALINEEVQAAVEAQTGHPTVPPSPSSAGPSGKAGRTSRIMSLAAAAGEGDIITAPPPPAGTGHPAVATVRIKTRQPAKAKASPGGRRNTG